jgi:hypothetical protein
VPAPVPQDHAECTFSGTPSFLCSSLLAEAIAARLSAAGHVIEWHEAYADDSPLIILHGTSLYLNPKF